MVLSCLKSKCQILVSCRKLYSNKVASHQGQLQKFNAGFNPKGINLLLTQKRHELPFNISSYARNKVRIFSCVTCLLGSKTVNSRFLIDAGMRFFHGNRAQVQLYWTETGLATRQMEPTLVRILILAVFGSCVLLVLLLGRIERIPISGRFHLVLSSKFPTEREVGEKLFEQEEEKYHGRILPPDSPESIRVQRILREIVQGMHSGLRLEKDCRVRVHECNNPAELTPRSGSSKEEPLEEELDGGRELIYQKPMERIQKKKRRFGWRYATKHLDGLNWEVLVLDNDISNLMHIPNGKIVICAGLLRQLKSDAEVAAALGHEVGHGIARHWADHLFKLLWVLGPLQILYPPDSSNSKSDPIGLWLSFIFRRREMEADYIGMMLMASAGYDPRVAPGFRLKLHNSDHHDLLDTHPCGLQRANKLEDAEVVGQAMEIYKDVKSGLGVKSFV